MRLFDEAKPFFKGNFHCHTTRSDGRLSPDEVKEIYRAQGHDFLAFTDHRILSEEAYMDGKLLMLPGVEMDFELPGEALHILGFGMDQSFSGDQRWKRGPQECIDTMRLHGGRAIIAHPAWSLNTMATLSALRRVTAAEIYNTVSNTPWNGERANSSGVLDVTATHGVLYNFVACDDSHFYEGEAGYSYTMVQAEELSQRGIIRAMDAGRFYCSQGPRFEQITVEDGQINVRCSPVEKIIFYSDMVWSTQRCQTGHGRTSATYCLENGEAESFVRVQLVDAENKSAWSNPIPLA